MLSFVFIHYNHAVHKVNFSEWALAKNCNELSMPVAIYIIVELHVRSNIWVCFENGFI